MFLNIPPVAVGKVNTMDNETETHRLDRFYESELNNMGCLSPLSSLLPSCLLPFLPSFAASFLHLYQPLLIASYLCIIHNSCQNPVLPEAEPLCLLTPKLSELAVASVQRSPASFLPLWASWALHLHPLQVKEWRGISRENFMGPLPELCRNN